MRPSRSASPALGLRLFTRHDKHTRLLRSRLRHLDRQERQGAVRASAGAQVALEACNDSSHMMLVSGMLALTVGAAVLTIRAAVGILVRAAARLTRREIAARLRIRARVVGRAGVKLNGLALLDGQGDSDHQVVVGLRAAASRDIAPEMSIGLAAFSTRHTSPQYSRPLALLPHTTVRAKRARDCTHFMWLGQQWAWSEQQVAFAYGQQP